VILSYKKELLFIMLYTVQIKPAAVACKTFKNDKTS